jgi:hypothetical protein
MRKLNVLLYALLPKIVRVFEKYIIEIKTKLLHYFFFEN